MKANIEWISTEKDPPEYGKSVLLLTDFGIIEGWREKSPHYPFGKYEFVKGDQHGCGCCAGNDDEIWYWSEMPDVPEDAK